MKVIASVGVLVLVAATSADAATIVGHPLDKPVAAGATGGSTPSALAIPVNPVPGSALPIAAPSAGVLTKIRLRHGAIGATPPTFGWRLASGTQPNFTLRRIGLLADSPLPANQPPGILTYDVVDSAGQPAGAPVVAGDRLAWAGIGAGAFDVLIREAAGTTAVAFGVASEGAFSIGVNDVSAVQAQFDLEPDADRDTYGDETQDSCVGTPGSCRNIQTITVPGPERIVTVPGPATTQTVVKTVPSADCVRARQARTKAEAALKKARKTRSKRKIAAARRLVAKRKAAVRLRC